MTTSRREFLGGVAGTVATLLPVRARTGSFRGEASLAPAGAESSACALLDLQACCGLLESLAGYELGLTAGEIHFTRTDTVALRYCRTVIVPGFSGASLEVAEKLQAALEKGARVLLESGVLFADASSFKAHQKMLRSHFGVEVQPPINLWHGVGAPLGVPVAKGRGGGSCTDNRQPTTGNATVPYVDYVWPVKTKIRDFSRVVPLSPRPGDTVVAHLDGLPVGLKRKAGKGTLIYLGSPIGPALLAGDAESRIWLNAILAA